MIETDFVRRRALALLGAGATFPSAAAAAAAQPAPVPEAVFTPDDGSSDIAGGEDMRRRLVAPVTIDGKGPFDFMVDTGTNRSLISDQLAAELGLPKGPPALIHGIAASTVVSTVKIGLFEVGGRQAANLTMAALPHDKLEGAGILGVDGLKDQRLVFNLPQSRLQIIRSDKRVTAGAGAVIHARRRFGQLTVVDTDLAGARVSVLVDTGAEASIGNSALKALVQSRARATPEGQQAMIEGVTGEKMYGEFGSLPEFRIGPLVIRNLRVAYADLHPFALFELTRTPALLMGMDIMRFFEEVELDFGRSEVRLLLPKTPYIDPAGDPKRA